MSFADSRKAFKKPFAIKKIDSAGTGALVGHEADETAALICERNGFTLDGHKGQQFTSSLARKYDLILVMEKEHIEKISEIAPEARGKTMLLGYWIGQKEILIHIVKAMKHLNLSLELSITLVKAGLIN